MTLWLSTLKMKKKAIADLIFNILFMLPSPGRARGMLLLSKLRVYRVPSFDGQSIENAVTLKKK